RGVNQPAHLLAYGGGDLRVAVAQAHGEDAAEEIEILMAIRVPDAGAGAAHERGRPLGIGVGGKRGGGMLFAGFGGVHSENVPRLRKRPRPGRARSWPLSTMTSPRESTWLGAPTTLRPS